MDIDALTPCGTATAVQVQDASAYVGIVWNQLSESTDFSSLSLFMRNVHGMDISRYLLL